MTGAPTFLLWTDEAEVYAARLRTAGLAARVNLLTARSDEMPAPEDLATVDGLYAKVLPEGILDAMPRLRWLQAEAAGADRFLRRADLRSDIVLTSGRGIHRVQMPDTILGAIFHTTKPFVRLAEQQRRGEWNRIVPRSVAGTTLAIFGLGAIGAELARRAQALEMRVLGVTRSGAAVAGVERVYPFKDRFAALAEADHVVLVLPLTPATTDMVDRDWLAAMKPGAWLYNFSRGAMIVDADLLSAVDQGVIAGAVLDAYRTEPLPPEHPFWRAPNILLLPHVGGLHPDRSTFIGDLIVDNIARFLDQRPLRGVVDRALGY